MLRSRLATPILTFAFPVLFSAQATVDALSGAVSRATRQAIALLPALCRLDLGAIIGVLTRFRAKVRRLSGVVASGAGPMLVVLAWH
jgi:hypothetical protein